MGEWRMGAGPPPSSGVFVRQRPPHCSIPPSPLRFQKKNLPVLLETYRCPLFQVTFLLRYWLKTTRECMTNFAFCFASDIKLTIIDVSTLFFVLLWWMVWITRTNFRRYT